MKTFAVFLFFYGLCGCRGGLNDHGNPARNCDAGTCDQGLVCVDGCRDSNEFPDTGIDAGTEDATVDGDGFRGDESNGDGDQTQSYTNMSGKVHDFQTMANLGSATVEAVKMEDGSSFDPPIKATSAPDGAVSLSIPSGITKVGVKVSKANYMDTLQYDLDVNREDHAFLAVPKVMVGVVAGILEVMLDNTKGVVVGGTYWSEGEEPIGCAVVTSDPANESIYYFDDSGMPVKDRTSTNKNNGYFVVLNMPPGQTKVSSRIGEDMNETMIPMVFANSVCINNIIYDKAQYDTNPTPDGCH